MLWDPTRGGYYGSIWTTDYIYDSIWGMDDQGSFITSFSSASDAPYGIDVDSNGSLWVVDRGYISGTDYGIVQMTQTGSVISVGYSPGFRGLGIDPNDSFWHSEAVYDSIYHVDRNFSVISSIYFQDAQGIGVDTSGSLWVAKEGVYSLYKLTQTGSAIRSISAPYYYGTGVGGDNGCIWQAYPGFGGDYLYRMDTNGSIVDSFAAPCTNPWGVGVQL